jgi:PAS domain S-box-containing protein
MNINRKFNHTLGVWKGRNLSYTVIALVSAFLTIVLLVAWFALERMDRQLRAELVDTLVTVNKSVNVSLDMWLENRTREIQHLAQDRDLLPLTQQLLALPRDADTIRNSQVLERMRTLYRYYMDEMNAEGFFIIAPDYISIGSMRDANIGTRNLIADQLSQLMKRAFTGETVFIPPIYSDVPLKDASGRVLERTATMFFATPLYDPSGTVVAVLTLRFDPVSEFARMTHVGQVGATGETYAFDRQARLLTESRFDDHLAMLAEYFPGETRLLSMRIKDPGGNLLKGFQPASERDQWPLTRMAKVALNKRDGRDISGYRDYRGIPVIGAWSWLDRLDIGLATEIDLSEALQPYHAMRTLVLGALGGVAFVALLLTALTVWLGERARSRLQLLVNERTEELRKVVQAVEQSPLCVVITDMAGNIEHVNQTFTKVTGYEAHEVIGKNPRILKGGETPPDKYDSLWETILAGKVWHSEIRNRKKNGELYWGSISIAPVKNDAGEVTHFVAMTADITEAKKVEVERRRAEEELARQRILLASIIDTIPDLIFAKDDEGRYLQCNISFTEFLGHDRDRIIGRTDYDFFDEEIAEFFRRKDQEVKDAGTRQSNEEWVTYPDGTERLLETTKLPFQDNAGRVSGILGISRDITARQAAEAEIKASMERFRVLFEQSYDAHLIFSDEGVIDCNQAAVDMVHAKDKDELLGRHPSAFSAEFQPDGRRSAEKAPGIDAYARAHGSHRFDWIARRLDGEEFPVEITLTPVILSGTPAMLVGWHDLTERKAAEEALEKAKEAADAANQAKSAFLANMSHELRTPMNAILGYSEMLIEEAEDLDQQDFVPDLQKINKAGTHLLALINDVLDLAKVESGKMEAFAEDIDIDNLIDEVSGTAHPLMEKNNNTLSIVRGNELGKAHQDLTKLRQTLFNLLSNAAKFTHDGTITLHVNRSKQAGVDWLILAVSDTGIGIAEDKLEHVFEEFSQADDSTTRDYGGTGLGLAISRRFCKLLGGDLGAASELGKGSTFTIHIPVILPEGQVLHSSADTATTPDMPETELESLREAGPGSTILVIDDDPEAGEIIERYLTKDGYTVVTAASGEQGLRLAHELQPAVITLDVMMPSMDGWSVLRALKADPKLHNIPVIMLTMIDDRTRGYSLGAVDYLTKPVDRELLHKALSRYYSADEHICPVLLVDDDVETRKMMALTLDNAGWTVSEVGNGQEALDIMSDLQPRLILLDLMMPVMDGFDFLAAMRARPEWQHIPIIVITAKDLTGDEHDRLAGRVERVLEKNAYTREQLLERVSEAVAACNTNT